MIRTLISLKYDMILEPSKLKKNMTGFVFNDQTRVFFKIVSYFFLKKESGYCGTIFTEINANFIFLLRTLYNTDTHTSTFMCLLKDFKLADGYFGHNLTQYKCSPPPPPYSFLKVARFFSIR